MPLSSSALFHYTSSFQNLKNILLNGFKIKYSFEEHFWTAHLEVAIPMVSFCDIPLTQVKNHRKIYGSYTLGLNMKWANSFHLNPVFYLNSQSTFLRMNLMLYYLNTIKNQLLGNGKKELHHQINYYLLTHLLAFSKNYQAHFLRHGNLFKDYCFYNEREWRYIPYLNDDLCNIDPLIVIKSGYIEDKEKYDSLIINERLIFAYEDIEFLIVKNKEEKIQLIQFLSNEMKYNKYIRGFNIYSFEEIESNF